MWQSFKNCKLYIERKINSNHFIKKVIFERKLILMKNILGKLLTILGFAGCNILGGCSYAYGTPYADFEVKGVVTDGKNPIENVQVKLIRTFQEHERDWGKADTTNKQGQFSLQFGEEIFDDNTLRLKVIATDLNNTYQNDTSKIEFLWSDVKRNKKKRKDDWYDGKATKTVNFTLKEKNDK